MTRTAVQLSCLPTRSIQHHVAGPCRFLGQIARAPALRFACGMLEPQPSAQPQLGIARDAHTLANAPYPRPTQLLDMFKPRTAKARIADDRDLDSRIDPSVQGIQQQAFVLGLAQFAELVDALVDRHRASHSQARYRRTQLYELAPRTHRRPVHSNDQRRLCAAQLPQQLSPRELRLVLNAPMRNQTIDSFDRRFQAPLAKYRASQSRQAHALSAHRRHHYRRQHCAARGMHLIQVRLEEALYDTCSVHGRPPRWLVPVRRKSRSCPRCFCATLLLNLLILKSLPPQKTGETSAPALPLKGREIFSFPLSLRATESRPTLTHFALSSDRRRHPSRKTPP